MVYYDFFYMTSLHGFNFFPYRNFKLLDCILWSLVIGTSTSFCGFLITQYVQGKVSNEYYNWKSKYISGLVEGTKIWGEHLLQTLIGLSVTQTPGPPYIQAWILWGGGCLTAPSFQNDIWTKLWWNTCLLW